MFSINRKLLLIGYSLCADTEATVTQDVKLPWCWCWQQASGGQHATEFGRKSKRPLKKTGAGGKG